MKTLKQAGIDAKKFEFKPATSAQSKYKWDEIFNGEKNVLCKGDDYTVETDAMAPKIKTAARRRYKKVSISARDHDGNKLTDMLIVQARDMTPEEVVIEDAKRTEEKAKRQDAGEAEPTEASEEAA